MRKIEAALKEILSTIESESKIVTGYDLREDVLYAGFCKSPIPKEDFSIKFDDYIFSFKEDKSVVSITILNAKTHFRKMFRDMPPLSKEKSSIVLV